MVCPLKSGRRNDQEIAIERVWTASAGTEGFHLHSAGLGGWTLSPHHALAFESTRLSRGDGGRQDAEDLNWTLTRLGGYGSTYPAENIPATDAWLASGIFEDGIVVAPDGSVFFTESNNRGQTTV